MRIGHASSGNNIPGDNSGKEVCIRPYYSKPWSFIIRAKNPAVAEKMAVACERGCNNNCIGYSQARRNTLKNQAVIVNYDLSKIKIDCDCDCSSFMCVCAECAGVKIPYSGINAPTTRTMSSAFAATGQFDILMNDKYLNSPDYLQRGDILVSPGSHTVMALDNGSKAAGSQYPNLSRGAKNEYVLNWQMYLQQLGLYDGELDGIFGSQTEKAVKEFQRLAKLPITGRIVFDDWQAVGKVYR